MQNLPRMPCQKRGEGVWMLEDPVIKVVVAGIGTSTYTVPCWVVGVEITHKQMGVT